MIALGAVFWLDVDPQIDGAPAHGGEAVLQQAQISGDQGKQIGRLRERVFPADPVATAFVLTRGNRVAVGQQHRIALTLGDHRGSEAAHHIRAVEIIGNLAETLGLALGAEHAARLIQPFQRGIVLRLDTGGQGQLEACATWLQRQAVTVDLVGVGRQLLLIQHHLL